MHCALKFGFKASNNEAEYEALIAELNLVKEMKMESLEIYSDSQLVICQITDEYQAEGEKMAAYLQKAKDLLSYFSSYAIHQVPRLQNAQAYALAGLASTKDVEHLEVILVEFLNKPSIHLADQPQAVNCTTIADSWMTPIVQYLKDDKLLEDKSKTL